MRIKLLRRKHLCRTIVVEASRFHTFCPGVSSCIHPPLRSFFRLTLHLQSLSRPSPVNCSREGSSIVRHFIQTVWRPIFKKFDVKMPDQCPLHFSRDVFSAQELAKLHYRVNLWTCGLCGKSFYREPYLDMHMASKHSQALAKVLLHFYKSIGAIKRTG